ncbi:MAG: MarR family transcriptional regulator, partial [Pseudomonadota bacterium]
QVNINVISLMKEPSNHTIAVMRIWMSSAILSRKISAGLGAVHGIGFIEYMVLFHLINAPNKGLRRIDLANAIGRTASGVTRMLRPMEKIGLVKKESSPRDRRVSLVKPTAAGEQIFLEASATLSNQATHLLRHVDANAIKALLKILDDITGE